MDEFESIARLFRPLTGGAPEAADLLDDAAFVQPRPGWELVLTKDAVVEGVHFPTGESPDLVARKLLRVNLSDLAAKAAEPFGYLLAVAWPAAWDGAAREAFARGLAEDGARFGLKLLGGDTVSTPGPMTASVTALGYAPVGRAVRRAGARAGDAIFVTGTIGDGWLGLQAARGGLGGMNVGLRAAVLDRYRLPQPRLERQAWLLEHGRACMDVSDGLVADLAHLCRASGLAAELSLERLPLSPAGQAWLGDQPDAAAGLLQLATGGDDYELLIAASPDAPPGGAPLTRIGEMTAGEGVRVLHGGRSLEVERSGWRHA